MRQTRALLLLLLVAVAARGQASPDAPADKLTLLSGTVAVVANSEDMNGKKMKVGDEIPFTLRRDLRAGHFLVLREGTPLTARVKSFVPAHKGTGDQVELEFAPVPALDATPIRLTFHAEADTG